MNDERFTVLLIEDDPDHAELIGCSFRCNRNDMQLVVAGSLSEARELLDGSAPSVILCDYLLPDGNGLEMLRQYDAADRAKPPFVLLTSHGDETVAVEAMKAGATDYIVKSEKSLISLPDICRALLGGYRERLEKERLESDRLRLFEELQASKLQLQAQYDELQCSEARFLSVTETAPDAIISADGKGRITFFNQSASKMFGFSQAEALGQPLGILMPAQYRAAHRACLARWAETGKAASPGRIHALCAQRRDGSEFPVELSLTNWSRQGEIFFIAIMRDLTERKSQEAALLSSQQRSQKSEQLLNRAQGMAHIGCWERDVAADRLYWSDEVYRILGLEPQSCEASMDVYLESVHPEDRARLADVISTAAADGLDGYEVEYRVIRKHSEETRFVHGKCDHLKDADGKVERWVGIVHDITERKQMEMSLFEGELRFRTLANSGQALIWTSGTDKLCDYFNEPWLSFTGRKLEQELGNGWAQGVHPEDLARCLQTYVAAFDRRHKFSMEFRVRNAADEYRWLQDDGTPRFDAKGNFLGYIGHCLDITDRKRSDELIRQSEEKFSKAFNSGPVMISLSKLEDGTYLDVNHKFCELSGFSREEAIGRTSIELRLITPEDRLRVVDELLQKGRISGLELNLSSRTGKPIIVLYHGEVITVDGNQCLLSISIDLTERRHLEEQLRQSQKMEAVGQLAGGIAHDFNNILTVIMGYGNMLKMEAALDDEGMEALEQIINSSERAAQLTHGLLAFSRKQIMTIRNCNLNDIVHRVRSFLSRTIGENIQLSALCNEASLNVCVDSGQIEQVLMNLATNARDAMPGGGTLTIKTEFQSLDDTFVNSHGCGKAGEYAVITVSDNGAGMDKETQTRIFEPFFTTKKVGKGTGLGMAIVYGIVQQHNGFIYVYSELGVGTTFRIFLPAVEESHQAQEEPSRSNRPKGGTETILVAEDDPSVRRLVETVLKKAGYAVILAVHGQDCVDQFAAHKESIDLILMDMIMPKKNGIQAYQEIRVLQPGVKVLYSSGYASDFINTREMNQGEIEIVMKPVKPPELLRMVREILDRQATTEV